MKEFAYLITLVITIIACSANAEQVSDQSRRHSFTWVLIKPEHEGIVSKWIFDGVEYRDTEECLLQLEKIELDSNDTICIAIPENTNKDSSLVHAGGCMISVLLHHWHRQQHVKLEFYRDKKRVNVFLISWDSDGPYGSIENINYKLNGESIGDYESARKALEELEVSKGDNIFLLHRDKTSVAWRPRLPTPFPAPLQKWLDLGVCWEQIEDFQWSGYSLHKTCPHGGAFPGENIDTQSSKKSDEPKVEQKSQDVSPRPEKDKKNIE